jgi:hypothetical protein
LCVVCMVVSPYGGERGQNRRGEIFFLVRAQGVVGVIRAYKLHFSIPKQRDELKSEENGDKGQCVHDAPPECDLWVSPVGALLITHAAAVL